MMETIVARDAAKSDHEGSDSFQMAGTDIEIAAGSILSGLAPLMAHAGLGEIRSVVSARAAGVHIRKALARLDLVFEPLAADAEAAFRYFLSRFDRSEANLIIEVADRRTCPTFHCDNLHVRMIKTYFGPSTEYIDRSRPKEIESVLPGAAVFLKGRRHPTHSDTVHHRSPEVAEGAKRLCVIADF